MPELGFLWPTEQGVRKPPPGVQEPAWAQPGCIHGAWTKWEGFVSGVKHSGGFMAVAPSLVTRKVDTQAHPAPTYPPESENPERSQPHPADGERNERPCRLTFCRAVCLYQAENGESLFPGNCSAYLK